MPDPRRASHPLLPRLLILSSEAPQTTTAGGIVLLRQLAQYPTDRVLVVTNRLPPPGAQRLGCRHVHLPLRADRLNRTRFWTWKATLRAWGGPDWLSLGPIDRALDAFRPDVVATLMQDSWYYDLAARYARRRNLPLVLFIHDLPCGFEPVVPWLRKRQRARDESVYRQAAARLCVSPGMVEWFRGEFGIDGEALLPPRSDQPVAQSPDACDQLRQPGVLTLGFAGGLHYGYGEQLLRMLPVLRETKTKVELFGPKPSGMVSALREATDVCRFNDYLSPPEAAWRELVRRCDVVLQPYLNPPGPHELQYRTHFPSKLGDCLSLGIPLLITGPAHASGVDWCQRHPGCAEVVTDSALPALAAALVRLRDDAGLRTALATRAQAAARAFSGEQVRQRLHTILGTFAPRHP